MTDTRADTQMDVLRKRELMRAGNWVNHPVSNGATNITLTLPLAEQDASYGVSVSPNWLTTYRVHTKTTTSFQVQFGTAAGASATVDLKTYRTG